MGIAASPFLNPIAAEPEFLPVLPDTPKCTARTSDPLLARTGHAPYGRHGTVPPPHYRCLDQN
jgi:hypothetical protein